MEEILAEIFANILGGILQGMVEVLFQYLTTGLFNAVVWLIKFPGALTLWAFYGFEKPLLGIMNAGNDFGLIMITVSLTVIIVFASIKLL